MLEVMLEVMLEILKIVCLFLAVLMGSRVTIRTIWKDSISAIDIILLATGVVGFIYLQWLR